METTNKQLDDLNNELKEQPDMVDDDLSFLGGQQESKYKKFYYCKLFTKKGTKPHFEFKRMVDGHSVPVKGDTTTISGTLKKITFSEYEYEGQQLKTVRFLLETLNENGDLVGISWGCGWNMVLINLVNCILNSNEPVTSLLVSVYTDVKSGYNKSMFRINGKKPEWKYSVEQLNEKKEKIFNKKGELVKTELGDMIDFLKSELEKHLPIILPNFKPEDEVVKHQVNFVEESLEEVLKPNTPEDEQDTLMEEMFSDIEPTVQPSEQKLQNKNKKK